jgi:hypothetical protein
VGLEDTVIAGASLTHHIALVEGQVILFEHLGHIPMPETMSTASTDARLGADDCGGQNVIAGVAKLPVGAAAGLFACRVGDVVAMLTMQARDGVGAAATGERDLLKVLAGEVEGPEFAGVEGALVRYSSGVHSCLL